MLAIHCVPGRAAQAVPIPAPPARFEASGDNAPDFVAKQSAPDIEQGYVLREDTWSGKLNVGENKAIAHHLTKGNEYRFYLGTDVKCAKVSLHVYDQDGNLVEADSWQKPQQDGCYSGATMRPTRTGSYYLIIKVEQAPEVSVLWGMAYAYK